MKTMGPLVTFSGGGAIVNEILWILCGTHLLLYWKWSN